MYYLDANTNMVSGQRQEKEETLKSMSRGLLRLINMQNRKKEEESLEKLSKRIEELDKKKNALISLHNEMDSIEDIESAISLIDSIKAAKEDKFISEYLGEYRKVKHRIFEYQANIDSVLKDKLEEEKRIAGIELLLTIEETNEIKRLALKYPANIALVIFNTIFNSCIEEKLSELSLSKPEKTYRYELYARVLFSELFWRKTVGEERLICVDEGQDVSFCEYERIIAQNKKNQTFYNIYGDLNQRIKQGRGLKTWEQLNRKLLAHEYELNENYRNTNQITQYCNDVFNFDMTLTGVEGEPVRNITFDEMLGELVDYAKTADRTAIILPRTISKQRILRAKRVDTIKERLSTKFDVSKFSIMYVDEIKGIEFDRVYVLDQDLERNERYIAFTRALDNLIIVH